MTGGSIFPFTKGVPAHNLQKNMRHRNFFPAHCV